jgi:hypothetical protein
MKDIKEIKGFVMFGIILGLIIAVSLLAYVLTGSQGIEERFNNAVGISHTEGDENPGWLGFSVEGNPYLYVLVLGGLGILCFALYKYSNF